VRHLVRIAVDVEGDMDAAETLVGSEEVEGYEGEGVHEDHGVKC
jgi:hypothetical protein